MTNTTAPGQGSPLTDREVLDRLADALRAAYDHPAGGDRDRLPPDLARRSRGLLDEALHRRGLTVRRVASHARLPGRWIIGWLDRPADRAAAYAAEIHHLERELAAIRLDRAHHVRGLRFPPRLGGAGMTKTAIASVYAVSRPTIDDWIADAEADLPGLVVPAPDGDGDGGTR